MTTRKTTRIWISKENVNQDQGCPPQRVPLLEEGDQHQLQQEQALPPEPQRTEQDISRRSPTLIDKGYTHTGNTHRKRNDDHEEEVDDDDWLDRPFFRPEQFSNNDKAPQLLRWFAQLVEQDYDTAEALFASFFIALLVFLTQDILRFQMTMMHIHHH